jgi:hypothetical protein
MSLLVRRELDLGDSIWATLVVAAGVTAAMRLRIEKSWPFIAFVTFLSAGLVFRELWKSRLRVAPAEKPSVSRGNWRGVASAVARPTADTCDAQEAASDSAPGGIRYQAFFGRISFKTLLILLLGLASTGFLLWPCLTRGAFVSVTGDNFLYSAFGLIGVQAPNDLEHVNGKPFVWLGNKATRFLIVSKIAQTATFSAGECLTGPSRPEDKDRQIRISTGGNVFQADVSGALPLRLPLKPGLNFLDIACRDSSTVSAQANGDTQALPIGLWDYRISSKEGVSN